MKKYLMTAVAALAAVSFNSCTNEIDMFEPLNSDKATIDLNVSNDILMVTRASSEITDYTNWLVKVAPQAFTDANNNKEVSAGATSATDWISASASASAGIGTKTFKAGGYNIAVKNFADDAAVYAANDNKGAAYYEGSINQELVKGSNSVTVDCGQAKNCRVNVSLSALTGPDGLAAITNPTVTLTQEGRGATCPALSDTQTGYFKTGTQIGYTLNYYYNDVEKHSTIAYITAPAAHTEYSIVASTNTTGKITLTIECDGTFDQGDSKSVVIDAATGNQDTTNQ